MLYDILSVIIYWTVFYPLRKYYPGEQILQIDINYRAIQLIQSIYNVHRQLIIIIN